MSGSPPWPSMIPSPTMAGLAPMTVMKLVQADESLTPTLAQSPGLVAVLLAW